MVVPVDHGLETGSVTLPGPKLLRREIVSIFTLKLFTERHLSDSDRVYFTPSPFLLASLSKDVLMDRHQRRVRRCVTFFSLSLREV